MKIAIVSSGNSIHVKKIANALVAKNHSVTLFTMPDHTRLLGQFDTKIKIEKLPFPAPYGYYLNSLCLRKKLIDGEFDLINSHYASGYGTLVRLARVHPVSLAVFGSDVFDFPYRSKLNMHTITKNFENADVLTSTSKIMVNEMRKFYKTDREIYVTPFGVDTSIFYPRSRDNDSSVFRFGIVKKIEKIYGIDILLKAFSAFCNEHHDSKVELLIYGSGSALEEYKELAEDLKIDDKVFFKGFIRNELVPTAFANIDVACFPSVVDESFGVAVVEAMACGVPVIASNVAGFAEVVADSGAGMLIDRNNVESLLTAMNNMFSLSDSERRIIGEKGVRRVESNYVFDSNIETYETAIMNAVKLI